MDDGIRVVLLDELAGLLQDLGDYDEPCASARPPPGRSPAASGTCGGVVDADSGSRGNRGNHARARLRAGCIAVGWLEDWRPACHAKPVGWADEGSPSSANGTRMMGFTAFSPSYECSDCSYRAGHDRNRPPPILQPTPDAIHPAALPSNRAPSASKHARFHSNHAHFHSDFASFHWKCARDARKCGGLKLRCTKTGWKCTRLQWRFACFHGNVARLQRKCIHFHCDRAFFHWKCARFEWKWVRQIMSRTKLERYCTGIEHKPAPPGRKLPESGCRAGGSMGGCAGCEAGGVAVASNRRCPAAAAARQSRAQRP